MRIVLIGENPQVPSGFGMQMEMLARGLGLKHEVTILATNPPNIIDGNVHALFCRDLNVPSVMDTHLNRIRPDAVIVFYHTQQGRAAGELLHAPANCPIFIWLPWEGSALPKGYEGYFTNVPNDTVVHLSEYAKDLWKDHAPSKNVIPHAFDPDIFNVDFWDKKIERATKRELRRKWSERLRFPLFDDSLLILNLDRNIWHKRWDMTFSYLKELKARHHPKSVQLIAHTIKTTDGSVGGITHDLEQLAKLYGVWEQVCFTDFGWFNGFSREELAELYKLCDFRLSTSQGEGFGIPTLEAAACGCPQIINNSTTMPEIVGSDYSGLIDSAGTEERLDTLWKVPDTQAMVTQTLKLYKKYPVFLEECRKLAETLPEKFGKDRVVTDWDDLIASKAQNKFRGYYQSHWGFKPGLRVSQCREVLPNIIRRLKVNPTVIEAFAFDGLTVRACLEYGIEIYGYEPDENLRSKWHPSIASRWTGNLFSTDVLVLTTNNGGIVTGDFEWILYRPYEVAQWNSREKSNIKDELPKTHTRRTDLEGLAKEFVGGFFEHQIWHIDDDTSYIPEGFRKK